MKKTLFYSLALLLTMGCSSTQAFKNVDTVSFDRIIAKPGVVCLDVRTPAEYSQGALPGAVNLDVKGERFEQKVDSILPKGARVAVYCRSGRRSATAAEVLAKKGYRVYNLRGGILEWRRQHPLR